MRNKLVESILDRRNRPDAIKNVLKAEKKRKEARRNSPAFKRRLGGDGRPESDVVKGVYRGNYFRIKIPKERKTSTLPKIPAVAPPPNFSAIVNTKSKNASSQDGDYVRRGIEWLQDNWPTLLLNFGSVCTLAAFTRSDVLELRSLSATGSLCNALFHMYNPSSNFPSIIWPSIFAGVNGYKIGEIIVERRGDVHMTENDEEIYVEHFLQHGVTPKMFEQLMRTSEKLHIDKGDVVIRKGETVDHVYLVVSGSTRASILGRSLTAFSTSSEKRAQPDRMHSGTWICELNFLDWSWEKHIPPVILPSKKLENQSGTTLPSEFTKSIKDVSDVASQSAKDESADARKLLVQKDEATPTTSNDAVPNEKLIDSLYTIVAKEDCVVWRWSFEEMDQLMDRSADMRGALTRAMTSAITAKVVNLTLNRATQIPTWSAWLSDWTREDGASVQLRRIDTVPEDTVQSGTGLPQTTTPRPSNEDLVAAIIS